MNGSNRGGKRGRGAVAMAVPLRKDRPGLKAGMIGAGVVLTLMISIQAARGQQASTETRLSPVNATLTPERHATPQSQADILVSAEDLNLLDRVSNALSRVALLARPSVVSVQTVMSQSFDRQRRGSGSGVIIDSRGYIVTSAHVLEEAREVEVTLSDHRRFQADIVGKDPKTDVAVLRISATNLTPIKIADSSSVQVGHLVLAIGNPFRLSQTVSKGIVSATGRANLDIEGMEYQNFIQTDAPTNPGNSGGALVNTRGELIGINTAIAGESGQFEGVAFATPSNTVMWAARRIIAGRPLVRGYLGVMITPVYPEIASRLGLTSARGAFIQDVLPDGPAGRAGLRAEDIVLQVDNMPVTQSAQFVTLIAELTPGARSVLTVWREGRQQKVEVIVGEQPQQF